MQRKEVISVCMATYNGEKYIKEQLISILCQLEPHDEVIISDDGSSDKTLEVIQSLNDQRITIFKNNFKNVVLNFEFAIKQAKGDYIFLSDQDDIWEPNKVKVCLEDLKNGFDLTLSDCSMFDSETGIVYQKSYFDFIGSQKGVLFNIKKNSYIGCCMSFSAFLKEVILPFPKEIPMHDSWIGILGEIYFQVRFNEKKLIRYRKHSNNASDTSTGVSSLSLRKKMAIRFNLGFNLLKRIVIYKIKKWH